MAIRPALLVFLTAILAEPAVASAKQVEKAQVCGASECFTFNRHNSGGKLALFDRAGNPAPPPPRTAAWYRLRISVSGEDIKRFTFTNAYVPSADRIRRRADGCGYEWVQVIADLRPVLRNVSAPLEPLPASTLSGLDVSDAQAQAREVVPPARQAAPARAEPTGTSWRLIAVAAAASAPLFLLARRLHRRRRPPRQAN